MFMMLLLTLTRTSLLLAYYGNINKNNKTTKLTLFELSEEISFVCWL